jgi:hypothetical protein
MLFWHKALFVEFACEIRTDSAKNKSTFIYYRTLLTPNGAKAMG